jgi:hypothetical protein
MRIFFIDARMSRSLFPYRIHRCSGETSPRRAGRGTPLQVERGSEDSSRHREREARGDLQISRPSLEMASLRSQ